MQWHFRVSRRGHAPSRLRDDALGAASTSTCGTAIYRPDLRVRPAAATITAGPDIAECGGHRRVDAALERHDQLGQPLQALPAPLRELRLVPAAARMNDVDLGVDAFEAQCEPFLLLSAIASTPGL